MKKFVVAGMFLSLAFSAQAQANERNGNNECNQAILSGDCIKGRRFDPSVQPPPVVVPPPPIPPVVVLPPDTNHRYDWRRRHRGVYLNFETDPYYDTYNDPNYNDDPNYDDGSNYYRDPYPRVRINKCSAIAKSLRRSGFRQVRSQKCSGRNYIYTASRDGDRLRLTVSSSTGRILGIRRTY